MSLVLAIDFDGTIAMPDWPDIGPEIEGAIDTLKHFQSRGCKLILWTCRSKRSGLPEAIWWCRERDLNFESENTNAIDMGPVGLEKVWADIYIDDAAIDWVMRSGKGPFTPERWNEIRVSIDAILDILEKKGD
jgi:hypothetical protein